MLQLSNQIVSVRNETVYRAPPSRLQNFPYPGLCVFTVFVIIPECTPSFPHSLFQNFELPHFIATYSGHFILFSLPYHCYQNISAFPKTFPLNQDDIHAHPFLG